MKKHQKWLAILFATLLLTVGITAFSSQKANAAGPTVAVEQTVKAEGSFGTLKASPAVHINKVKPKGLGGGISKPLYRWLDSSYCYWSGISTRSYYCYRYACTYFERVAWGCYDGYVRITTYTYA